MASAGSIVAANVRAERGRRRWLQRDLAERLGWSRQTVGDLESGKRRVTMDDMPALCAAFDVTLARLLDGAEPEDLRRLGL